MTVVGNGLSLPILGEGFLPDGVYISHVQLYGGTATDYERGGDTNQNIDTGTIGALVSDSAGDAPVLWGIEGSSDAPVTIHALGYNVQVGFTASVTITLGDTADAAGWANSSEIVPGTTGLGQAADTLLTLGSSAAGFLHAGGFQGRTYFSTGQIIATVAGADPATGLLDVFVVYSKRVVDRRFA